MKKGVSYGDKCQVAFAAVKGILKTNKEGSQKAALRLYIMESYGLGSGILNKWLTDLEEMGYIRQDDHNVYWCDK